MPDRDAFQLSRESLADGVGLIAVQGEADRFRTDAVRAAIEEVRRDDQSVVLDVSAATYIDSSMLAALVSASEQARRFGDLLVIVCANERLRRSLELKGLEAILTIADDRDHALALLAAEDSSSGAA
jgi:anti-sigma B factor antagonist